MLRVNEVFQRTAMKRLLVKYKDLSRHINPVVISFHMTAIVGPFFRKCIFQSLSRFHLDEIGLNIVYNCLRLIFHRGRIYRRLPSYVIAKHGFVIRAQPVIRKRKRAGDSE